MEKTLGERIKMLRTFYKIPIKQFGILCGLSYVGIYIMERGKTNKPHDKTLNRIANVFGTTVDWILTGRGEMFPEGMKEIYTKPPSADFFTSEMYLELKNKNQLLEKEVERLWQLIEHITKKENSYPRLEENLLNIRK